MAHMLDAKLLSNYILGSSGKVFSCYLVCIEFILRLFYFTDLSEGEMSWQASSSAGVCCGHQRQHFDCNGTSYKSGGFNPKQLVNKKIGGIIKLSPEDEIEGEIIFYQLRLLANAVSRKRFTGILIVLSSFNVHAGLFTRCLFSLPHETPVFDL